MTMYEKYQKRFEKAVENYNNGARYKVDFNQIDSLIGEYQLEKGDNEYMAAEKCKKFYKSIMANVINQMEIDVKNGDVKPEDIKDKAEELRGLLGEFATIGIIESSKKGRDFKNKAIKNTDVYLSDYEFKFYDKTYYQSIDVENSDRTFTTLTKDQQKGIKYKLKNFSGVVDYNAELKNQNKYNSETLIQNLKDDKTSPENCNDENIMDYLVKYEALKQKHESRNPISRFFHFKEKNTIKEAETNIQNIINKVEDFNTGNRDCLLAFVSKKIRGSNILHKLGTIFISRKECVDFSKTIREPEDSFEVLNATKEEVSKELDNELKEDFTFEVKEDLNKTVDEKELLDDLEK